MDKQLAAAIGALETVLADRRVAVDAAKSLGRELAEGRARAEALRTRVIPETAGKVALGELDAAELEAVREELREVEQAIQGLPVASQKLRQRVKQHNEPLEAAMNAVVTRLADLLEQKRTELLADLDAFLEEIFAPIHGIADSDSSGQPIPRTIPAAVPLARWLREAIAGAHLTRGGAIQQLVRGRWVEYGGTLATHEREQRRVEELSKQRSPGPVPGTRSPGILR